MGKRKGTKKTNNGQKKRDKKDKQWAKEKGQKRQTMGYCVEPVISHMAVNNNHTPTNS